MCQDLREIHHILAVGTVEFSLSLKELLEAVNKRLDCGLLHLERRSQTWWNLLSRLYQIDNNKE